MSNMSYCRFRNTLSDLRDCYENWDDPNGEGENEGGGLSEEETKARARLLSLCEDIVSDYGEA